MCNAHIIGSDNDLLLANVRRSELADGRPTDNTKICAFIRKECKQITNNYIYSYIVYGHLKRLQRADSAEHICKKIHSNT